METAQVPPGGVPDTCMRMLSPILRSVHKCCQLVSMLVLDEHDPSIVFYLQETIQGWRASFTSYAVWDTTLYRSMCHPASLWFFPGCLSGCPGIAGWTLGQSWSSGLLPHAGDQGWACPGFGV